MKVPDRFRSDDLDAIRAAVAEAEERTSGEIVTYIVGECDAYPEAVWRGGCLGLLMGVTVALGAHQLQGVWSSPFGWALLGGVVGFLAGGLLGGRADWFRRWMVRDEDRLRRVSLRAESAFLEEEVFDTRERTGILIFVALFEHRVVVLGDAGINSAVEQEEWQVIVDHIVEEMKAGRAARGILRGVEDCGRLLQERGVRIRHDDRDELPNEPRLRER